MKRKLLLYCKRDGEVKVFFEKNTIFDVNADWLEVEFLLNIPDELFKKPTLKIEMTVAETRKEYEPILKTSSFGLSELRAKLPDENNTSA